jgi:AAA family ATP:ADP antiporter
MLLATLYGFLILFAYSVIRPVRDEISTADRGNLQIIWTVVFLVMLVAVPAYSWFVARWSRARFIPFANRCFVACLIGFFAALELLPEAARPWIDRAFYVWSSVFALFVVTVYWGFLTDLFDGGQGRRLFGFITVGSSLGAILGATATTLLAERVAVFVLLLLACVPLELSAWAARWLHRWSNRSGAPLRREAAGELVGGTAWSGIGPVFRSPRLRLIALYLLLMTFASTVLYFQQAEIVGEAFSDRGERRAFLARLDVWVQSLTLLGQALLAAHAIRWLGLGLTLALLPAVAFAGFGLLGVSPILAAFVAVQVLYNGTRHAMAKPAREVLFTGVSREERYKSKAFIDAAVYRGGDLVSGWAYAGMAALGLSLSGISVATVPLAAAWILVGLRLGNTEAPEPAPGSVPAPG